MAIWVLLITIQLHDKTPKYMPAMLITKTINNSIIKSLYNRASLMNYWLLCLFIGIFGH